MRDPSSAHKSIFDPIHGAVTLDGAPLRLIGDPAFQRLWGIRQTGLAHLVFPGANHTRLEHSIGVYWVARKMSEALALDRADADAVTAGGLLHDIGHAPLSHTLDPSMLEVLGMGHERRSRRIVTGTLEDEPPPAGASLSEIPAILERHRISPRSVADLIDPPEEHERRPLLRSLLHGPIDADRIDYLQRDAHYTGVGHGAIDAVRLLDTIQVVSNRLAFAEKGRSAVEGFLVGRSLMYSTVYYHKTVRAAEVMAQAAVERMPGYPESARPIFAGTDGDLFARLEAAGGRSGEIAWALRERRLYRRVFGWRQLPKGRERALHNLAKDPESRRYREDEMARRIGGPPGSVLLDLAGLADPGPEVHDWKEVVLIEGGRPARPFASPGVWDALMHRSWTAWPASIYVDRAFEREFRGRKGRLLRLLE
ncbi:MAG TPA: HD domain-containing protein [Thermoplasmata archaeon]|nr:HD domain-containing protein [Thermoplasmata archaeon]